MTATSEGVSAGPRQPWWRRWFVAPIMSQLTQGISVERISWSISLGIVLGVFPIFGTTTVVCLLAGWVLRLNHVAMQVFKEAVYPIHLLMIPVFIRLGERLAGAPLITFSITGLIGKFRADPLLFAREFGMAAWHGLSAWLLIAPVAAVLLKWMIKPIVRQLGESLRKRREVAQ